MGEAHEDQLGVSGLDTLGRRPFRAAFLSLLLLSLLLLLGGCWGEKRYEWHNKFTIVVQTPSGPVTATTVIKQILLDHRDVLMARMGNVWHFGTVGEALVLDLGPHLPKDHEGPRYLFALLLSDNYRAFTVARRRLDLSQLGSFDYAKLAKHMHVMKTPAALRPSEMPLLVTFTDINDPASVKRVDPRDLDASFGCNVKGGEKPWRAAGVSRRQWHYDQDMLKAAELASRDLGLPQEKSADMLRLVREDGGHHRLLDINHERLIAQDMKKSEEAALRTKLGYADWSAFDRVKWKWSPAQRTHFKRLQTLPQQNQTENHMKRSQDCYRLKSITLEITDEPVTEGRVEEVLGWLGEYYGKRFDGKRFGTIRTENPFANSLAAGAFDTEKN